MPWLLSSTIVELGFKPAASLTSVDQGYRDKWSAQTMTRLSDKSPLSISEEQVAPSPAPAFIPYITPSNYNGTIPMDPWVS